MRLYISNLNRFTTASQVVNLFHPFGQVMSARIITNSQNGPSAGSAELEMGFNEGLLAIQQLNNVRFMNYFIRVEEAFANLLSK